MAELEDPRTMENMITFLSSLLQRIAESNDMSHDLRPQRNISAFHGLTRPTITIQSYLQRISKYANCSPSCFIVAYVYLDRFTQRQPSLPINSFNVHRLLITSVLVAAKFMDDLYYNNAYYAKIGGISTEEMNYLEMDFLFGLGFQLNVTPSAFHTYYSYLQTEMMATHQTQQLLLPPQQSTTPLNLDRSLKVHNHNMCFNEDDTSHQSQQQQQLAV